MDNPIEKIMAIRDRIMLFGGTTIGFSKHELVIAYGKSYDEKYMLYDIRTDRMIVGRCGDKFIKIPITWMSELHLKSILTAYINACREQLTEEAFRELEEEVGL